MDEILSFCISDVLFTFVQRWFRIVTFFNKGFSPSPRYLIERNPAAWLLLSSPIGLLLFAVFAFFFFFQRRPSKLANILCLGSIGWNVFLDAAYWFRPYNNSPFFLFLWILINEIFQRNFEYYNENYSRWRFCFCMLKFSPKMAGFSCFASNLSRGTNRRYLIRASIGGFFPFETFEIKASMIGRRQRLHWQTNVGVGKFSCNF